MRCSIYGEQKSKQSNALAATVTVDGSGSFAKAGGKQPVQACSSLPVMHQSVTTFDLSAFGLVLRFRCGGLEALLVPPKSTGSPSARIPLRP